MVSGALLGPPVLVISPCFFMLFVTWCSYLHMGRNSPPFQPLQLCLGSSRPPPVSPAREPGPRNLRCGFVRVDSGFGHFAAYFPQACLAPCSVSYVSPMNRMWEAGPCSHEPLRDAAQLLLFSVGPGRLLIIMELIHTQRIHFGKTEDYNAYVA